MIKPIRFLAPKFKITPEAKNLLRAYHDDELLYLGLSTLRESVLIPNFPKETFLQKLFRNNRPFTRFTVTLDKGKQSNFVLQTEREINGIINIWGNEVPLDLRKAALDKSVTKNALAKSKEGILKSLNILNDYIKHRK